MMVDEMQLLAEMRSDIPEDLLNTDRGERLFLQKVSASTRHSRNGRPRRAGRPTARRARPAVGSFITWGAALAGSAALAVVILAALGTFNSRPTIGRPQTKTRPHLPAAVAILHVAAQQAAAITPLPEPPATQWIYFRTVQVSDGKRTTSNNWLRFDGGATAYFQDGKLVTHLSTFGPPSLRGGNALTVYARTGIPMSAYAALTSLKRSPSAVLNDVARFLTRRRRLPGPVLARSEFHFLATLLWTGALVPTRAQANVFEALAHLPGITVEQGQVDAAGQPAVAIGSRGRDRVQLLLDPRTYRVLGIRTTMPRPKLAHPRPKASETTTSSVTPPAKLSKQGTITTSIALAQTALAAKPGER